MHLHVKICVADTQHFNKCGIVEPFKPVVDAIMQDRTVVVQNLAEMTMNKHQQPKSEQSENLWHDKPAIINHVGCHPVAALNTAADGAATAFPTQ